MLVVSQTSWKSLLHAAAPKQSYLKLFLCPHLVGVVVLECHPVSLMFEKLFKHDVSGTFEGAMPFVDVLCHLVIVMSWRDPS